MHSINNHDHNNRSTNNHSVNSGNQLNINNTGSNSPITIEMNVDHTNSQPTPKYTIKQVNPATLKREKLHELIIPAILSISDITLWLTDKLFVDGSPWDLILSTIQIVILCILIALVACTLIDYVNIHRLNKIGQIGYYLSKRQMLLYLFRLASSVFSNNTPTLPLEISRLFKNENNTIFEIKGCACPFCNSNPIGYMRPSIRVSKSIKFVCSQNTDYVLLQW